ncbi:STAS domain-containing protein [Sporosarcina obsidiansis]|uniref:STAS domain-containing protein n=1 Tax=Sporosarcina obsidiansis TaxID=2660748 RepID=UPI00129BAAD9|nr:STAS domain-containing protein [Sporosarcina obsidiansis]
MIEAKDSAEEIKELREKIKVYEKLIEDLSAPIIPSILPETILVPLTGALSVERFMHIQDKIVQRIASNAVHTVIIDFTEIGTLEVEEKMGYEPLSEKIHELVSVLKLMGTETLFVGFSPVFAQHLILSNVSDFNKIQAFTTFRMGLQYIMKQTGMEIVEKK